MWTQNSDLVIEQLPKQELMLVYLTKNKKPYSSNQDEETYITPELEHDGLEERLDRDHNLPFVEKPDIFQFKRAIHQAKKGEKDPYDLIIKVTTDSLPALLFYLDENSFIITYKGYFAL